LFLLEIRFLFRPGIGVIVERNAGEGSGINDQKFTEQGAEIAFSSKEVYEASDLIIKVNEPISDELGLLRKGQILFCFLHLAAFLKPPIGCLIMVCCLFSNQ
jgi:alanine dehydrogenase